MKKKLFILLMLISLLLPINIFAANNSTVDAIEYINVNSKANLTIDFNDTGYDFLEDGETSVKIYRIASVSKDFKFEILDGYNTLSINLKDINDTESWDSIANTINSYIISENLTETDSKSTISGKATFNELELGLYLVVPAKVDTTKYLLDYKPYIVNVPYLEENGTWNYNVVSRPKPIEPIYYPEYYVIKNWSDNGRNRPEYIDVQIYKDGELVDEVEDAGHYEIVYYFKSDNPNYDPTDPDSLEQIYTVVGANWKILDAENSPVEDFISITCDEQTGTMYYNVKLSLYKFYGYYKMPKFLMGTDKNGKDMLKYVFEGLRTSLLLGILTFIVCFIFGLIWGSVSGYFGGTVDLVMERFTDILHGVPWIVVMTLAIKHLGQSFFVFGLSICLTGWIGTAATTRTQFYRFRGREYVLASRSLGANDARLIAKHILPNAMGTIITSSVLMIPSVIFSEATISYLGLGLKGLSSLGVILSDNQTQLTIHPYLLIFPATVIALLMISFNLFGNGLRDAVNPSLKGEEQ